jgi:hypothetical protein
MMPTTTLPDCCREARFTEDALCWCAECHGASIPVRVPPANVEEWVNELRRWKEHDALMVDIATCAKTDAVKFVHDYIWKHRDKGVVCPGCAQYAKLYKRKINAGMVKSLRAMYSRGGTTGWVTVPEATDRRSREEGKLAYWDLITEYPGGRPDGGRAGYWRVTEKGRQFLFDEITVPKYAEVYAGVVLRHYGVPVNVRTALTTKFNYDDLMAGL